MISKKERNIKVYSQSGYYGNDQRPAIFLQGKWVRDCGFDIGDQCTIKCEKGRIIITKTPENQEK